MSANADWNESNKKKTKIACGGSFVCLLRWIKTGARIFTWVEWHSLWFLNRMTVSFSLFLVLCELSSLPRPYPPHTPLSLSLSLHPSPPLSRISALFNNKCFDRRWMNLSCLHYAHKSLLIGCNLKFSAQHKHYAIINWCPIDLIGATPNKQQVRIQKQWNKWRQQKNTLRIRRRQIMSSFEWAISRHVVVEQFMSCYSSIQYMLQRVFYSLFVHVFHEVSIESLCLCVLVGCPFCNFIECHQP